MKKIIYLFLVSSVLLGVLACSKGGGGTTDPCSGVTVTVTGLATNTNAGASTGTITVSASGGSGFTYSVNGGAFQASGSFTALAAGSYTVTAKNSNGCSGSASFTVGTNTVDPCAGKTFTVAGSSLVASDLCSNTGSVTVTTTGGTGLTYNINGGTFQPSNVFTGIAVGNHTIGARDVDGCVKTASITIGQATAGTLFTAVKNIIQTSCVSCHSGTGASGGRRLDRDCDIVSAAARIKVRAVDGTGGFMPTTGALPQPNRDAITNWINAGGKFTN
jgi:hypothetical protein